MFPSMVSSQTLKNADGSDICLLTPISPAHFMLTLQTAFRPGASSTLHCPLVCTSAIRTSSRLHTADFREQGFSGQELKSRVEEGGWEPWVSYWVSINSDVLAGEAVTGSKLA